MNLRDQLREILPEILPANPAESIKGTDLIQLVKYRLRQTYSDATLRYHFSIMCCDPSSPIAKVDQGQGYYLRHHSFANINSARHAVSPQQARFNGSLFDGSPEQADSALSRADQFRAIYRLYEEAAGRFPFVFESSFAVEAPYENFWKCPDSVVVDWHLQAVDDEGPQLNAETFEFKQSLGVEPFVLSSTKLKLSVSQDSFREDFFQTLSISRWAQKGQLIIASSISDEHLAENLRQLGTEYGIGIRTLGLDTETLDDLPLVTSILQMQPREQEALLGKITPRNITAPAGNRRISWELIESVRRDNKDFEELFDWLQACVRDQRAHPIAAYRSRVASSKEPVKSEASEDPATSAVANPAITAVVS
jgi:hypothetical protein